MSCKQFGHLSTAGSLLGGAVIWIGAMVGLVPGLADVDRIGRISSIVAALIGFVVVYVLMVTVAFGTAGLVPLYCLLGVVTWLGASACWPLPSELPPTAVRGRAQGLGSGLQRFSIGVNVLLVPHMLVWVGFRGHGAPGRGDLGAVHPARAVGPALRAGEKSLEVASGDQLLAVPTSGLRSGLAAGWCQLLARRELAPS